MSVFKKIQSEFSREKFREQALPLIRLALAEDIGAGDITSKAIVAPGRLARCIIKAKEELVVCGLWAIELVFEELDKNITVKSFVQEGTVLKREDMVCSIEGPAGAILAGERTALNFLQHLSGIAGKTRQFVKLLEGTHTCLLDTRKTTPGLRWLEKYAVKTGGGTNHRMGLYDMYLIKDNHISLAGSVREAIRLVRSHNKNKLMVEVECRSIDQVKEAWEEYADVIMLDNMDDLHLKEARRLAVDRCLLEASGNITAGRIKNIARIGIDYISSGALTHSAPAADYSLLFAEQK
ncbi:MAG: nicotinate-nucleotide diphosphorylase (carboxylating) [Spirochaetes bacterium GWF1_41_5]|nr:MAG: nicotinate-nucleotide diphosphorylase (carboxylating) [Spirochaetes bacterium GWF1_41_5]HBE02681.1 carboxylating nicotinate-nucleotide diphosphorylase [Spirochaetia bacterium]